MAYSSGDMKQTVCLTMIVKDEARVIRRCLDALKPFIDHALIIDTGSTDETPRLISEVLPDATIEFSKFESFQHNRTELLERARLVYPDADYHLMIDADDTWVPQEGFEWPELKEDLYHLEHRLGNLSWWRPQILRASKPFRYGGVAHEKLECDVVFTADRLQGVRIQCGSDGARRVNEPLKKYERVADQLQADHFENPKDRRTVFYLAQSYRDSLQRKKALYYYEMRAEMGGWAEEVWYSKYQIGRLREMLGHRHADVLNAYLDAFTLRPGRSESMVAAASLCRRTRQRGLQLLHASAAIHIPYPKDDRLFVEWTAYDWRAWDEFAMACWHLNRFDDCLWANFRILCQSEDCPEERIISNIASCSRPGDKLDDLKAIWKAFRARPKSGRTVDGLLKVFIEHTDNDDLVGFESAIYRAIEHGGGFPK